MNKPQKNMYQDAFVWNVCKGCNFDCVYCRPSFQRQAKRHNKICKSESEKKPGYSKCYTYEPHFHSERLEKSWIKRNFPKETKGDEFIWAISSGDIACMESEWVNQTLEVIKENSHLTFFMQSKDPSCFKQYTLPDNLKIGITLETNRNYEYTKFSKAPKPKERWNALMDLEFYSIFITIEPIMDFDFKPFLFMIKHLDPERVYIGYDTKNCNLPEPSLSKTLLLIKELEKFTKVKTKLIREKHNKNSGNLSKWVEVENK